jgi:uncharacterized membrane protein YqaE (UPF0057 family)
MKMLKKNNTLFIKINCLSSHLTLNLFNMKTKNLLWVALLGLAVSCTVSKRIDKWGYKVSFNKKHQSELSNENVAAVPMTEQSNTAVQTVQDEPVASLVETARVEPNAAATSPMVKVQAVKTVNANESTPAVAIKMNKKAERIMAKLNSNEAKASHSNRTENWVYILLILLVPFGTVISMFLYEGSWTKRVTTNLLLTLLCGLPGLIHALVVIFGNK